MCKHRRDFDMILRGIILSFGDDGATLKDITTTYEKLMYKKLPMHWKTHDELNQYIGLIDNVCMQLRNGGLAVWYVEETDHSSSSETDESTTEEHCNVQLRNKYIPETAASSTTSTLAHMQVAVEVHNQNNSPLIPSTSTDSSDSVTKRPKNVFPTAAPLSQRNVEIHNQNNPSPKPSIERSASTAEKRPASASAPAAQLGQRNVEVHNQSNSSSALSACSPPMAKKRRINVESTPLRQQYVQQHHTSNLPPMPTTSTEYSASNCSTGPSTSDQQPIQSTRESTTAAPCYEIPCNRKHSKGNRLPNFVTKLGTEILIFIDKFGRSIHARKMSKRFADLIHAFKDCLWEGTIASIRESVSRIQHLSQYKYAFVNLGAMDILLQRGLLEIQNDYKRLISTLDELQVKPVIFTIPVRRIESDDSVGKQLHQKLLLFNAFLLDTFRDSHIVIDLWQATKVEPSEQHCMKVCINGKQLKFWLGKTVDETVFPSLGNTLTKNGM